MVVDSLATVMLANHMPGLTILLNSMDVNMDISK